jgi:hypothetical protein
MNHPTLGLLESKGIDSEYFEGVVKVGEANIDLKIELDAEPQNEVFEFAENIVSSLSVLNGKAKSVICRDLLETYNSGWNEYDEMQDDGSTRAVVNPQLDAGQFSSQFVLASITICGTDCVEFWYKPNNLFWGHSVFVTSFDGINFEDTNAQMFG